MIANSNHFRRLFSASKLSGLALAAFAVTGCKADEVVNANQPSQVAIDADVRAATQIRASGAMALQRALMPGFVSDVGILGRESLNYTGTEARNTTDYLRSAALTNVGFLAGGQWAARYRSMLGLRDLVLLADREEGNTLTPAERSAVKGFANTLWALDMYYVIATRDTTGAPTELVAARDSAAPFQRRDSVYRFILGKLDEGRTQLQAGGGAFPFALTSGFTGFNTPSSFLQFNRALYARVAVHFGTIKGGAAGAADFTAALTALSQSFLDTSAPLTRGVYYVFSTATGDALNGVSPQVSPDQLGHPSLEADAAQETQLNGSPDARYTAKVTKLTTPRTAPQSSGIATALQYRVYPTNTSPIPIIRNEELILLRAEANIGLGNLAAAITDINFIRVNSGGLAPSTLTPASGAAAVTTALLRQKRLSLLFEGHRWVDLRRYGRITELPLDQASHIRVLSYPVPQAECDARANVIRRLGAAANVPFTGLAAPTCAALIL
ncbi:MAG TPA: RagB/SusD family nutrient uptake outer membrane protein [Gemmatimonadaceae bacterium]|nr:RagB/SusD family nutrient uptake outer membrane protein [Gemmatimonadaceae bacterium]